MNTKKYLIIVYLDSCCDSYGRTTSWVGVSQELEKELLARKDQRAIHDDAAQLAEMDDDDLQIIFVRQACILLEPFGTPFQKRIPWMKTYSQKPAS